MRLWNSICPVAVVLLLSCGTHPVSRSRQDAPGITPAPTIIPASLPALTFTVGPTSAAPFQSISPAIEVAVLDSNGRILTSDSGTAITLTLGGQPGTLCGTLTQTTVNGVATFPDINVYEAGEGFTLTASAEGSRSVTSGTFSIWSELDALAGSTGGPGNIDGAASVSRLSRPSGVAVDSQGNVYVTDRANNNVRLITPRGRVTTVAGSPLDLPGSADGIGPAASFSAPAGVAVDAQGNVYIADTGNNTIRRVFTDQSGNAVVTTLAGSPGVAGSADGAGGAASFNGPTGLTVDHAGNVYVDDSLNGTIRKITAQGVVTTLAGTAGTFGSSDGTGGAASFGFPLSCGGPIGTPALTVDANGTVFVADAGNGSIRKITAAGVVTTLATSSSLDGVNSDFILSARPSGIAVDSAGDVFFADTEGDDIVEIPAQGATTIFAGTTGTPGFSDSGCSLAAFNGPTGLALDASGNLYVADANNSAVRLVSPQGVVTTLVGSPAIFGDTDGVGTGASFAAPTGVAVDSAGNTWVADSGNRTVRSITAQGVTATLQNDTGTGPVFLGGQAGGIAVDSAGNLYVADMEPYSILKITPEGVATTLVANSAAAGVAGVFYSPAGIAVDRVGNVYFADVDSNTVRKVTPGGRISILAGNFQAEGSADGTGTAATFNAPQGVAVDSAGNIYVADSGNNTLRRITPDGVVTTLAGSAAAAGNADGQGAAARFQNPQGLAVDPAGNIYVADAGNGSVRKVTQSGLVTTIVGAPGVSGIETGPLPGGLRAPIAIALRPSGELVIVDTASILVTGGSGSTWRYRR